MKILHTADWHLGQKLRGYIRDEEHILIFDWLIDLITAEEITVLIIAGDIFDVMNPPNSSRKLYYKFLARLLQTPCRHIVIIGGNHDAPSMLDAPKELLETLNIHVVGCATDELSDEILVLKHNDQIEGVIAAVPFLRDQDIRKSVAGEEEMEIYQRIQEGIYRHYAAVAELCAPYQNENVPILATGHLYASGVTLCGENQNNIYMGNIENIEAEKFPTIFDYVALGHIHTAQPIAKLRHVRYSGSLIPLSFKENKDKKSVTIIDFNQKKEDGTPSIKLEEVPKDKLRQLLLVEGNEAEVIAQLMNFDISESQFRPWVKVEVKSDAFKYALEEEVANLCKAKNMELLLFKSISSKALQIENDANVDLTMLDNKSDIFKRKCASRNLPPEKTAELENTFQELLGWMQEQEIEV